MGDWLGGTVGLSETSCKTVGLPVGRVVGKTDGTELGEAVGASVGTGAGIVGWCVVENNVGV